ncbi:hypothetical protein MMAG44476_20044 [Mycolicibacterium mageritense DSM 44476 = CIP 104973]|uniref:WXG100 family type VII secretion target n=1 Tax=Mycolicibacterium mageritense TaxID=53462 RepID=A0ABM7HZB5_MYCME|nr:hypothetical protein [Mycolicibacterium mageritense]BBX35956.1 hypothetical protein MMAGJ_52380 [Mycolicibacterium mageritense]CDO24077.1 hypothetical protein BN978_04569 [Mycolicibacterium mageritense DSM 44476 = CIP 104973]
MSDEITVDPEALANERQRLTALSSSISATITAIDTAAADVLTETAEWGTKWEALGAYDPTAASLNEGMVKIAASLGAIKSELDNQAQVTVTRAEDTEELEAEAGRRFDGIDTDLGTTGRSTPPPADSGSSEGSFKI